MAVNRIWFSRAPSGSVSNLQRSEIGIGYSFNLIVITVSYLNYLRRYLNDSDTLDTLVSSTLTIPLAPASSFLTYLRSYLGDQ